MTWRAGITKRTHSFPKPHFSRLSAGKTSLQFFHFNPAAEGQGSAFVDAVRLNVEDPLPAIGGDSPRLFDEEGHWAGLVQQTQFSARVVGCWRVEKDAPLEQSPVDIGHH